MLLSARHTNEACRQHPLLCQQYLTVCHLLLCIVLWPAVSGATPPNHLRPTSRLPSGGGLLLTAATWWSTCCQSQGAWPGTSESGHRLRDPRNTGFCLSHLPLQAVSAQPLLCQRQHTLCTFACVSRCLKQHPSCCCTRTSACAPACLSCTMLFLHAASEVSSTWASCHRMWECVCWSCLLHLGHRRRHSRWRQHCQRQHQGLVRWEV